MLKYFSLTFLIIIILYFFVLILGINSFIIPAASVGLAGDPIFGFTLLVFLSPLVMLLYYVYYLTHSEVKSHLRLFAGLFMALTLITAIFLIIFILPLV